MVKLVRKSIRITPGTMIFLVTVMLLGAALLSAPALERFFQSQAGEQSKDNLRLTVEGLSGALHRYEPLPGLIAERPELRQLLKTPGDTALIAEVNEDLRLSAHRLKASDIYLMDRTGLTLAASSYLKERSFVGRSFSYRPYFTQALEGGLGQFFALGTTSGERGYFFAAPVEDGNVITGVVAIKFTVDTFEEAWRNSDHLILVSDLKGVVFMSNRSDWHFRTLSPLSEADLTEIRAYRQYPIDQLLPLKNEMAELGTEMSLMSIEENGKSEAYVASSSYLADAGWTVTILSPTAPARTQALVTLSAIVLSILLTAAIGAFFLQRRARLLERIESQRAAQELLETRVEERTADLNRTNKQLIAEVKDRRAAELRLRQTQAELVQAGKLAALGQMSTALSHEFNQPLAAVKSYADNAVTYLDRGMNGETRENIGRISEMADRMASISKHLRNFARRPMEKVRPVPLLPVVSDAIALLQGRFKTADVELAFDPGGQDIWVIGGHVRLQQVVVNLLSNALDAVKGVGTPRVEVSVATDGDTVSLIVRDHGQGLQKDAAAKIFDPFFTTKQPGEGLGLGLSISYNIIKDFQGTLAARNHPDGGAEFVVSLKRAIGGEQAELPPDRAAE